MVEYKYDAWGNHAALYLNKVNDKEQYSEAEEAAFDENYAKNKTLAELNSFRYRGYYYDEETGLYYLKSRYYDPEVGRFITIDDISYIDPETINGLNLYAYCGNNPVMNVDSNGTLKWWQNLLIALGGIVIIAALAVATVATGGAAAGLAGAIVVGALKGSVIRGVIGAAVGAGIGYAVGGIEGLWTGLAIGFTGGALIGAVIGGTVGGLQYGTFSSKAALNSHYTKHGIDMGFSNSKEYAKAAKYVVKNGQKISYTYKEKVTTGYIRFFGQGGGANYAFVGMKGSRVATFGIRSVSSLIKDLGITLFII